MASAACITPTPLRLRTGCRGSRRHGGRLQHVMARSQQAPAAPGKVYIEPVEREAAAFAPATVANLGPGFDWMGCAVEVRVAGAVALLLAGSCSCDQRSPRRDIAPGGSRRRLPAASAVAGCRARATRWGPACCPTGRARWSSSRSRATAGVCRSTRPKTASVSAGECGDGDCLDHQ